MSLYKSLTLLILLLVSNSSILAFRYAFFLFLKCLYKYINKLTYIHAPYILNIDTNNYIITSLDKAFLERPVFPRQVGSCSVYYKLNTSWLLEPTYWPLKQNFINYFIIHILKSHFWMSDLIVRIQRVSWSQAILNPIFADILSFYVANCRFS